MALPILASSIIMYRVAIDKSEIHALPSVSFAGKVVVIDSMFQLNAAIRALRQCEVVGFDTETRPSFRKGEHHKVALIQLSTPDICFLFRVNKIGIPQALADYLADASCLKIGLSLQDDFRRSADHACAPHSGLFRRPADLAVPHGERGGRRPCADAFRGA